MPARRAAASTAVPPLPPLPLLLAAAAAGWMVWSPGALASNWAQVSGPKQQNTAKVPALLLASMRMATSALLENAPPPCLTPEEIAMLEAGGAIVAGRYGEEGYKRSLSWVETRTSAARPA